ncbi:hypothetical protein [Rhodanobacter sp. MP1X3]|uniref:hypothetical protein n=1 Tax=Rhodanobacter sp. MP1X3 TaxID=2723086 RepID=UPI00161D6FF8|nr:hypothetical protein [Rhodanobacter sp. MP1X3]MBB6244692.1 hypothetical protein [Rhodanobacter sp. MP1X3]
MNGDLLTDLPNADQMFTILLEFAMAPPQRRRYFTPASIGYVGWASTCSAATAQSGNRAEGRRMDEPVVCIAAIRGCGPPTVSHRLRCPARAAQGYRPGQAWLVEVNNVLGTNFFKPLAMFYASSLGLADAEVLSAEPSKSVISLCADPLINLDDFDTVQHGSTLPPAGACAWFSRIEIERAPSWLEFGGWTFTTNKHLAS